MSVLKSTNADDVYRAVAEKIGLSKSVQKYFYLFEIVEYNFGKLLNKAEVHRAL